MYRTLPITNVNRKKYGKPPTWHEIESFLNELGINKYRFELFYGIPHKNLEKVKCGAAPLAPAYWHIFYEKIRLNYGVGFQGVYEKLYGINDVPKRVLKKVPSSLAETGDSHDRLIKI